MRRTIRSFVMRGGRMSPRQETGLNQHYPKYAMDMSETSWDFPTIFNRASDVILEIGFGMGASLVRMAQNHPARDFIGIEVHRSGVGSLAADLHDTDVKNVRIVMDDAVEVLKNNVAEGSLTGFQIFFPDPWPKKRHHKRRLIQPELLQLLTQKLKPGGWIHCATDWQEYAEHMLEVLSSNDELINQDMNGNYSPRPDDRPLTKFENRGLKLGHGVWDLIFIKKQG